MPDVDRDHVSEMLLAERRGLADEIREIAAEQFTRGFLGRSPEDLRAEHEANLDEDIARDQELEAARRKA